MKKIISYSLWGTNPKYTEGAVCNAREAKILYPDWTTRFYCGTSVPPAILEALREAEAEVIIMPAINDNRGRFWRFLAAQDRDAERIIFRDTDSRLTKRERDAVWEWQQSGLYGHIMRDHPYHAAPLMAGMWGCLGGLFLNMNILISNFNPTQIYDQDQSFLECIIYKKLIDAGCLIHDEFFRYEKNARPFPLARKNYEFVGEAIGADGMREEGWTVLEEYEKSCWKRFRFACKRNIYILKRYYDAL
jgi:hypothetical protein